VVLLVLLLKVNLNIEAQDSHWTLSVRLLGVVVIHRKYEARREHGDIFTLYCIDKPKARRVISLLDIIKTIQKREVPKSNERARRKLFSFIHSKSSYNLNFRFGIGLDDAFATAMLCGLIKSLFGAAICYIKDSRHKIQMDAVPVFAKRSFSLSADCIIALSLTNIIIGYMIYQINKRR
jgi:hypothetical protein